MTGAPSIPRLSVVMPSRDHRAFIGEALASIPLATEPAIEAVVADGASRDGTPQLLAELAAAHAGRLRWRSAPDAGPAAAVNSAVASARGALIGWLNSDDRYAPGAVGRALRHFDAHPDHVLVYGHGEHVDLAGRPIGRYPTRPPEAGLAAFAEGCFVCQPTAFFRREAFQALGGLDESLRTAFDFDLWLRLFKAWPGRIGFIDAVLAHSRVHAATITLRERRTVALEGLRVLHRHLGRAPTAWLKTWFDERAAQHPFTAAPGDLRADLHAAIDEAREAVGADGVSELRAGVLGHAAWNLATPQAYVGISADGWAGPWLDVRWRQPDAPADAARQLELACEHAHPLGHPMRLVVHGAERAPSERTIEANGRFTLALDLDDLRPGACTALRIQCIDPFVPAELDPASGDRRALGFRVMGLQPLGLHAPEMPATGTEPAAP
jgi:GT2 family glycosyltransferase